MLAFIVTNGNRVFLVLYTELHCYSSFYGAQLQGYVETERDFSYYGGRPSLVLCGVIHGGTASVLGAEI